MGPRSADVDVAESSPVVAARVTLRDVAAEAGVSLATASRALDPSSRHVAQQARERVLAAAAQLGYTPNTSARATTTGAASTIAVVVSDIRAPLNAHLVHGAIERANRDGLIVTITGTDAEIDDERRVVRMLRSMRPRAIVLTGNQFGSRESRTALMAELDRYVNDGGRVVVVGEYDMPFDTVVVPRKAAAAALVAALVSRGYRRPCLIGSSNPAAEPWESGVLEGVAAAGMTIEPGSALRVSMSREGAYGAVASLAAEGRLTAFDILLTATDAMALGVLSALRDNGIRAGIDIAVAGFGDAVDGEDVTPTLTSVSLALEEVGRSAVDLAVQGSDGEPRVIRPVPEPVLRESTPGLL